MKTPSFKKENHEVELLRKYFESGYMDFEETTEKNLIMQHQNQTADHGLRLFHML